MTDLAEEDRRMKDKLLRSAIAAGMVVLGLSVFAVGLGAASYEQRPSGLVLGLNGDYVLNNAADHGNCIGGGVSLLVPLTRNIAVEVSGGFDRYSTLGDSANPLTSVSPGHLTQIPLQAMIQLRLPLNTLPLVPYITAGGGLSLNSFSLDETMVAAYKALGLDLTETVKSSFILSAGAGIDVLASANLIVGVHFRYRFGKADGSASITDQVSHETVTQALTDINLKSMVVGLGVKYVF
jgi:opacity protein-like surface antigen